MTALGKQTRTKRPDHGLSQSLHDFNIEFLDTVPHPLHAMPGRIG
jgi:hypothetical protein